MDFIKCKNETEKLAAIKRYCEAQVAENEDAALEEYNRMSIDGELDFSDGEIVDTDTAVELDDSNRGYYIPTQPRRTPEPETDL